MKVAFMFHIIRTVYDLQLLHTTFPFILYTSIFARKYSLLSHFQQWTQNSFFLSSEQPSKALPPPIKSNLMVKYPQHMIITDFYFDFQLFSIISPKEQTISLDPRYLFPRKLVPLPNFVLYYFFSPKYQSLESILREEEDICVFVLCDCTESFYLNILTFMPQNLYVYPTFISNEQSFHRRISIISPNRLTHSQLRPILFFITYIFKGLAITKMSNYSTLSLPQQSAIMNYFKGWAYFAFTYVSFGGLFEQLLLLLWLIMPGLTQVEFYLVILDWLLIFSYRILPNLLLICSTGSQKRYHQPY